jgi:hypothetical protein
MGAARQERVAAIGESFNKNPTMLGRLYEWRVFALDDWFAGVREQGAQSNTGVDEDG